MVRLSTPGHSATAFLILQDRKHLPHNLEKSFPTHLEVKKKKSSLLSCPAHLHGVYFNNLFINLEILPACGQAPIPLSWDVVQRTHLLIIQQQMCQSHGALCVLPWLPKLPTVTYVFFHNKGFQAICSMQIFHRSLK